LAGVAIGVAVIVLLIVKSNDSPYTEKEIREFLTDYNVELADVANYVLSKCTFYDVGKLKEHILISFGEDSSDIIVREYKDYTVIREHDSDFLDPKIIQSIKKIFQSKIAFISTVSGRWDIGGACVEFVMDGEYSFYEGQRLVAVPNNTIIQEGVGNFVKLSDNWYYNYVLENPR
jgi:hypothetical protein